LDFASLADNRHWLGNLEAAEMGYTLLTEGTQVVYFLGFTGIPTQFSKFQTF